MPIGTKISNRKIITSFLKGTLGNQRRGDDYHIVQFAGRASSRHPPISGGDRKALAKELVKSRAMTKIFAERSAEKRREGEALIREADNLACQSWNEKMWSDGGPVDPSPTIARNAGSRAALDRASYPSRQRYAPITALPATS